MVKLKKELSLLMKKQHTSIGVVIFELHDIHKQVQYAD